MRIIYKAFNSSIKLLQTDSSDCIIVTLFYKIILFV